MSKTNFTKVEELLDQNLRKMSVNHLLEESDKAKASSSSPPNTQNMHKHLLADIKRELTGIKKNAKLYEKIEVSQKELKRLTENPEKLTEPDWEALDRIHQKLAAYKVELKEKLPQIDNESLVEAQRKKHITKRFNVNDKWLPLT